MVMVEVQCYGQLGFVYSISLVRAETTHGEIAWAREERASRMVILTLGMSMDWGRLCWSRVASSRHGWE